MEVAFAANYWGFSISEVGTRRWFCHSPSLSVLPQNYAMETSCLLLTGCKPGEGQRQASASGTFVPAELGRRLGRDGLAIAGTSRGQRL